MAEASNSFYYLPLLVKDKLGGERTGHEGRGQTRVAVKVPTTSSGVARDRKRVSHID